jgi:hypothetical protein
MERAILSFTLPQGLKNSSLATISPGNPLPIFLRRTRGVFPTNWVISSAIFIIYSSFAKVKFEKDFTPQKVTR